MAATTASSEDKPEANGIGQIRSLAPEHFVDAIRACEVSMRLLSHVDNVQTIAARVREAASDEEGQSYGKTLSTVFAQLSEERLRLKKHLDNPLIGAALSYAND